jgi:hypothetical protein
MLLVGSSWNMMAHGDAREGKWRGNWRMEWVASTLHTTSEHGVSSITTTDAHTSAASSRLNWRPRRFKRTRPFRLKTKSGFCACAITFQTQSIVRAFPRRKLTGTDSPFLSSARNESSFNVTPSYAIFIWAASIIQAEISGLFKAQSMSKKELRKFTNMQVREAERNIKDTRRRDLPNMTQELSLTILICMQRSSEENQMYLNFFVSIPTACQDKRNQTYFID